MVSIGRVHVNDKRTDFRLRVYDTQADGTNSLVDLTGVDSAQIVFTDPDLTETAKTASLLTPLVNGIISYVNTDAAFIDQAGPWYYRAKMTFDDGGVFQSNDAYFNVLGGIT